MNPDTQRQAEEERVLPETEWEQCPNCPNVGYYAAGDPQNPEQIQCEWCETNWKSPFYQTRNLPRILESLAVREREKNKEMEERAGELIAELAKRSVALRFYADEVSWEYDKNGLHMFAGAFEPPTMIEADRGEKARIALFPHPPEKEEQ